MQGKQDCEETICFYHLIRKCLKQLKYIDNWSIKLYSLKAYLHLLKQKSAYTLIYHCKTRFEKALKLEYFWKKVNYILVENETKDY